MTDTMRHLFLGLKAVVRKVTDRGRLANLGFKHDRFDSLRDSFIALLAEIAEDTVVAEIATADH